MGTPFAQSKDTQLGSDPRKPLSSHVYGNQFDTSTDYNSALKEYFVVFPVALKEPSGRLFPGSEEHVATFFKQLYKFLLKHEYLK